MYAKSKINIIFMLSIFSMQILCGDVMETSIRIGKDNPASVLQTNSSPEVVFSSYNLGSYGNKFDANFEKQIPIKEAWKSLAKNPYIYAGSYLDSESGLNLMGARYYSTNRKRFISQDSYNLKNRYQYANSDPINKLDTNGHSAWDWISLFAVAAASIASLVPGIQMGAFVVLNAIGSGVVPFVESAIHQDTKGMISSSLMIVSGLAGIYAADANMFDLGKFSKEIEQGGNISEGAQAYTERTAVSIIRDPEISRSFNTKSRIGYYVSSIASHGLTGASGGMSATNPHAGVGDVFDYAGIGAGFGVLAGVADSYFQGLFSDVNGYIKNIGAGIIKSGLSGATLSMGPVVSNAIFAEPQEDPYQTLKMIGISFAFGAVSGFSQGYKNSKASAKIPTMFKSSIIGYTPVVRKMLASHATADYTNLNI